MEEIWKDIKDYDGLYQISNMGRVKSLNYNHTGREEIMKPTVNKIGYLLIGLCKNGVRKWYSVHRLVAMAFLPNHYNYTQVNHKDENKTNNFVYINEDGTIDFEKSNLEWCDAKYNIKYGTRNKRVAEKTSKPVLKIDPISNEIVAEFPSINEVERQLGISHSNISNCCNGKRNIAGGFKWKFKPTT